MGIFLLGLYSLGEQQTIQALTKIRILDLKPQYQSIKAEIQAAIDRVLESGDFIIAEDVKLFERKVAEYLGVKYAIAVNFGEYLY